MTKFRLNHLLLLIAIIAFFSTQWTTTHVHLAKFHDHNAAEYHQHLIKVHTHQSIDHCAVATDVTHQQDYSNTIELGQEYRFSKNGKQKLPSIVAVNTSFRLQHSSSVTGEIQSVFCGRLRNLNHSTINPRAPPYTS